MLKQHLRLRTFSLACALALILLPAAAHADGELNHDYGTVTKTLPNRPQVAEYSRTGAHLRARQRVNTAEYLAICRPGSGITCKNFVPIDPGSDAAIPTVNLTCRGNRAHPDDGGWVTGPVTGSCWQSLTVCYGDGSAGNCTSVPGSPPSLSLDTKHCDGTDPKKYCAENHGAGTITGATGDDMFSIGPGAKGFFEYTNIPDLDSRYRLNFISRLDAGSPSSLMLPSGPKGDWTDYTGFIDHPPASLVSVDQACFPVDVNLCDTASLNPPSMAGKCGPDAAPTTAAIATPVNLCYTGRPSTPVLNEATGNWEWTCSGWSGGATASCFVPRKLDAACGDATHGGPYADAPATDLCSAGMASPVAIAGGTWKWTCQGIGGGQSKNCAAPSACIPSGRPVPPGQIQCPTNACFFYVSGALVSGNPVAASHNPPSVIMMIGDVDPYPEVLFHVKPVELAPGGQIGDIVGPGSYRDVYGSDTDKGPFYYATAWSFDGMALGARTHVTIYNDKDFGGTKILDVHGPMVINNAAYKDRKVYVPAGETHPAPCCGGPFYPYTGTMYKTESWASYGPLSAQFPPSTRKWSDEVGSPIADMNNWSGEMEPDPRGWPLLRPKAGTSRSLVVRCDP